jgi:hypothetical protein
VGLSWPATTDNWGVTGYLVYRDGQLVYQTTKTTATIQGETRAQTYNLHLCLSAVGAQPPIKSFRG